MKVNFKKWSRAYKETVTEQSIQDASKCHKNRNLYHILIEKDKHPHCFLEINNTFILVGFLDTLQREYMTYQFDEFDPGKLFLKHVQHWEYEGNTDERIFSARYFFSPDGTLKIEKADIRTNEGEVFHAKEPVDVAANYEKYPDFGQYEKLIKKERLIF